MIIFGTRGVTTTKSEGDFHCPQCGVRRGYRWRKVRRFFTLYFIPVIPLDELGEFVECGHCKGTFVTEVLEHDPQRRRGEVEAEYQRAVRLAMVQMMLADGRIEDEEVETIRHIYQQITGKGLSASQVRRDATEAFDGARDPKEYLAPFVGVLNDHGKELVIQALFHVALADRDFSPEEQRFLVSVGEALQLSPRHVRAVLQDATRASRRVPDDAHETPVAH